VGNSSGQSDGMRHEQVELFAVEQATFKTGRGRAEPRCGARQDAEENCLTPPTRLMDAVNNRSDARLHLAQCGLQVGVQARAHDLGGQVRWPERLPAG
jgi:hypothetical protein